MSDQDSTYDDAIAFYSKRPTLLLAMYAVMFAAIVYGALDLARAISSKFLASFVYYTIILSVLLTGVRLVLQILAFRASRRSEFQRAYFGWKLHVIAIRLMFGIPIVILALSILVLIRKHPPPSSRGEPVAA